MPKVNFKTVPDAEDYSPIPAGDYLCQLEEVKVETTSDSDEMWVLKWTVREGDHAGRKIFDRITWSESGMKRVKLVLSRLGIDVAQDGAVDYQPDHIRGRSAILSVTVNRYKDKETGEEKTNNKVAFAGYKRVAAAQETVSVVEAESSDLPF